MENIALEVCSAVAGGGGFSWEGGVPGGLGGRQMFPEVFFRRDLARNVELCWAGRRKALGSSLCNNPTWIFFFFSCSFPVCLKLLRK